MSCNAGPKTNGVQAQHNDVGLLIKVQRLLLHAALVGSWAMRGAKARSWAANTMERRGAEGRGAASRQPWKCSQQFGGSPVQPNAVSQCSKAK